MSEKYSLKKEGIILKALSGCKSSTMKIKNTVALTGVRLTF